MARSVKIGEFTFMVDETVGSSTDRDALYRELQLAARMPNAAALFSGAGLDHNMGANPVVTVRVDRSFNKPAQVDMGIDFNNSTLQALSVNGDFRVSTATIILDPEAINAARYRAPSGGDNDWNELHVQPTLFNELGNLAAAVNKNLPIPGGSGTDPNTVFGRPTGNTAANDPETDDEQWNINKSPFEKYSAETEDTAHDAYGETKREAEYDDARNQDTGDPTGGSTADPEWTPEEAAKKALTKAAQTRTNPSGNAPTPVPVDSPAEKLGAGEQKKDPLVLDLDHSGTIDLISLANTTGYFDRDMDGFAEASGLAAAEDGYLALDLNENGQIDADELFGTAEMGGFTHLAQYDSNNDDIINAEDTVWADLLVWQDLNENSFSETDELYTLADHDIISINLSSTAVSQTNQGHSITRTGTFTIDTGSGTANYAAHEVNFQYDNVNTIYVGDYELDFDALLSIDHRGYGTLPALYIAMSMDNTGTGNLLDLVSGFSALTFSQIFDGTSATEDDVRDIMFRWAGVDDVSSTSRGDYVDARELEFLEKLFDNPFRQGGHQPNPMYNASIDINNAFKEVFNHIYANLTTQGAGGELFEGNWRYNLTAGVIEGVTGLNLTKLSELETEATGLANTAARQTFWENVVRMIDGAVGVSNLDGGDLTALQGAITDSDATLDLEDDILPELEVDALPFGSGDDQTVVGSGGVDSLFGYGGNDLLQSIGGNDTLNGGTGSDVLEGGLGDDLYVYASGDGDDVIEDTSGADTISLAAGIDAGDITLVRAGNSDLRIDIDNGTDTGVIYVYDHFASGKALETILFSDSSTINITTQNYTLTGNSESETLYGVQFGGGTVDTIYGLGGNDKIYGYAGNDTLYGGDGNDDIDGGNDNDTLYGDAGNDALTGGAGNDHLYDGTGDDYVQGDGGDDTYHYGGGHDIYKENSGTDSIVLASGISSASTLYYRFGSDLQIVFDANNTITIDGFYSASGPKIETLDFYSDTDVNLTTVSTITQGDDSNNTLYGTNNAESIYGNGGNDTIHAQNGNDYLFGGTGNDTLNGSYGADWLEGGAGNDTMNGGNDNDTYVFTSGIDIVNELGGTDELRFIEGWDEEELTFSRNFANLPDLLITINGSNQVTIQNQFYTSGYGVETIRFADNSTINLLTKEYITYGTSSNNTINGITTGGSTNDTIYGYDGNDTLNGGDGNDTLYGGDGTDTLTGAAGNDYLDGGAGSDTLTSTGGDDTFFYGAGLDTATESGGGTDKVLMGAGIDVNAISFSTYSTNGLKITVTASTDELSLTNQRHGTSTYHIENIEFADGFKTSLPDYASWVNGTSGNDLIAYSTADDTIIAKAGNDTITAGGGNDDVHGGDGNDDISGQAGTDLLHGGAGNDILYGGDGLDTLFGGAGEDIFVFEVANAFNNIDVIKDFDVANDSIDISDILGGYDPMTDLLTDWVEMTTSGSDTILKVDRDGDGGTYSLAQIATIQGVTGLTDEAALVSGGQLLVA
ncbi:calcium-binding protein [Pseudomonas sp. R5(2019)]|uniref:calcium-binding protein n=1 Tax=Pseudomonas sp. R5(2019) TaxID=2697566 RepID=UPI001413052D|nr:calcium-binding protein [Pseudomonas sp. R5(2019)]NBA97855.1 type I secretion C-terminal target domain-containing protein [Pseudomonas sp. R5(2019)]